jgi:uncharacterized LabA/DUF88 family protein
LGNDLRILNDWIEEQLTGDLIGMSRGYASFGKRFKFDDRGTDKQVYKRFLAGADQELMKRGIEPVSVPALSGTKNAVDMRIAMEATSCMTSPVKARRIVLVAGDADYIPVILQVRRLGAEVIVVGLKGEGGTAKYLSSFANRFYFFEELIEQRDAKIHAKIQEEIKQEQQGNLPHSVELYTMLLAGREPRFIIVPRNHWEIITDAIYQWMKNHVARLNDLVDILDDELEDKEGVSASVTAVISQLWDSGCFILRGEDGPSKDEWDRNVSLDPEIDSAETMRARTRAKIENILRERLCALGDNRPLQAGLL